MISDRLKELINESNRSQTEIAESLGIVRQRLNNYVTGKREPDSETIVALADYFNVTTDYLLGRTEYRHFSYDEDRSRPINIDEIDTSDFETVAAHHDGPWTEAEKRDIQKILDFIKSQRKENSDNN